MNNPTLRILIGALVLCSVTATTVSAQALKPRGADWEVTKKEWAALRKRWEGEGMPRIAVLVSERGAANDGVGELLAHEMRSLLAGALGSSAVMQMDQLGALEQRRIERLARAAGGIDKKTLQAMRRDIEADLVFVVDLIHAGGKLQPVVEVIDNRNASVLASPTASSIDVRQKRWQVVYANAFIKNTIKR